MRVLPSRSLVVPRAGRLAAAALLALGLCLPRAARAQRTDVIRGRVTDDSGRVAAGADVVATRAYDLQNFTTTTDSAGRFQLVIANGRQDYLLFVSKAGFRPYQKRVQPAPGDSVITADVVLHPAPPQQLRAVQSRAASTKPSRVENAMQSPPGADAIMRGGVTASFTPDQMGDLSAMGDLMPGMINGSMFGLGAGQNGTLLDGMSFQGGALPRDADVTTTIATSAYDPSIGGFSGTVTSATLSPASIMNEITAHTWFDAPALEYNDPVAARLGDRFAQTSVSAGATGATGFEKLFYNLSGQYSRRLASTTDLLDADPTVLYAAGVSPDSAARAVAAARAAGIPVAPLSFPTDQVTDNGIFLGRIDFPKSQYDPGARNEWSLLLYGDVTRRQSFGFGPTSTPSLGNEGNSGIFNVQLVRSAYFGPLDSWLDETRSAITVNRNSTSPYVAGPGGSVRIASTLPDGTGGVSSLSLGGAGNSGSHDRSWTWETLNTTQWFVHGTSNRLKLYADSRFDGYDHWAPGADLGSFYYNSLAGLAANQPASYTRTLMSPAIRGTAWSGVLALGDYWKKSPTFQLEGGLRLETNRYLSAPAGNPAVVQAFGLRNDAVPNTLHLSPRLGFTWVVGHGQTVNSIGMIGNGVGSFYQGPYGVLRGGVGEWRGAMTPTLLEPAQGATGLPGASRTLTCIGSATPVPDWLGYAANPAAIPTQCADGSAGAFSDAAPNVQLVDPSYSASRSWRANLVWESRGFGFRYKVDGTYALNLDQPGTFDLNFVDTPRFTLASEDGRPVYVPAASIVPTTGLVSPVDARATSAFGRVAAMRSDLRGTARQITFQLTPDFDFAAFGSKADKSFWQRFWGRGYISASYTYSDVRASARGFDGATAGNPTLVDWAPSGTSARHSFLLQFGIRAWKNVSIGAFATVRSGLPYTPMVASDINGDGYANDRAFVFDPAAATDPALASQMRSLLAAAPSGARRCLERQLGQIAGRNSCTGPWTTALNLRLDLPIRVPLWAGRSASMGVNLANPLGGLDQLLHGANHLHGWGTRPMPDPMLYYVRGFDPATQAFVYDVNPRFGSTRASQNTVRAPFRLTLDVRFFLGRPFQEQMLDRSMALVKRLRSDPQAAEDTLAVRFHFSLPDIYTWVLARKDSLLLSPPQLDSLAAAAVPYRATIDSLIKTLADYIIALPPTFDGKAVLKEQDRIIQAGWNLGRDQKVPIARILSPQQYRALPGYITSVLDVKGDVHIRYMAIF
jgi:Carboxypeptidase regulatory-like domain